MGKARVIARLDIKGPNLVKGIHLEGLRVLGSPVEYARHYYNEGIDELFYMDVVASLYERNSLSDLVSVAAKEIFVPLTVGGGIRTVEDVKRLLRAGADKVCINTGAVKNPEFIREAVKKFGSSTIVAAIECIKQPDGRYLAFIDNGREETDLEVVSWAKKLEELGVGEIVVTSVDKEGTGEGIDRKLIQSIASAVKVPLIAHGGVGNPHDVVNAIEDGATGVAIASILHYGALSSGAISKEVDKSEGNTRFLSENRVFRKIVPSSVKEIKSELLKSGIKVRNLA